MLRLASALMGAVLLLALAPAYGQDFEKGLEAYESGDYATALREWVPLAEAGDAFAQINLAFMYETGRGVAQDFAEAARLYRLAAEQGNAGAQYLLGNQYAAGRGVARDLAEAARWYRLAAEQDVAEAQYNLGVMYAGSLGVTLDDVSALMWITLAAEQGHAEAVERRDFMSMFMTPADVSEAQRLAREWREAHQ